MRSRRARQLCAAPVVILGLLVAVEPAPALEISGLVTGFSAGSFSVGQLEALAPSIGGPTIETLGGDTFTGLNLWSLLGGNSTGTTSNITTVGGGNNPILRNYILATGGGGKTSLLSVGEIDPFFGGTGLPYLVAYQLNGATLASPILVVPQDTTRSRFVTGLDQLVIATVPMAPQGPRSVTQSFTLSGVAMPGTFTTADLTPPTTVSNVTFLSGNTPTGPNSYTGVDLWNFLVAAGLLSNPLNSYVLATGSDGFRVLFSLAELDPAFGARTDLLADSIDGGAPGTSLGSNGFFRTVIPGDLHGGRFVSNVASLAVGAVPEPATLLLVGVGMCALGLARWWRARSSPWPGVE